MASTEQDNTTHKLSGPFSIWEHRGTQKGNAKKRGSSYLAGISKLTDFDTVEQFWKLWDYIPSPSQLFAVNQNTYRRVESLSVFRQGIEPKWEDEKNAGGGEYYFRDRVDLDLLDKYWEETVLGLIGETLDPDGTQLCGVRVVDKTGNRGPMFRLELWFTNDKDEGMKEQIKQKFTACLEAAISASGIPTIEHRAHA